LEEEVVQFFDDSWHLLASLGATSQRKNPLEMEMFLFFMGTSSIWVNYNDLTATSLESWLARGIIPNGLISG